MFNANTNSMSLCGQKSLEGKRGKILQWIANNSFFKEIFDQPVFSKEILKQFAFSGLIDEIVIFSNKPDNMVALGNHYQKGTGAEKDEKKAAEFYEKAADCYQKGTGVEKDLEKAIELYQRAADLGNAAAMVNLSVCYQNGTGVEKDNQKAAEFYEKAADCYQNGTGVEKDNQKAAEFYEKAADCYQKGTGVEKDEKKAIKLYQRATDLGNTDAMVNLGVCYENGEGVSQDMNKAIELYQQASDMGNARAMVNLGICYENGIGVPKDMSKAIELYQRSADLGNACAMNNLGVCYENGIGVPKDMSKAIELYQRSADLGNADAMFNLGVCYKNGIGVPKDMSKAIELYQRSADLGNARAMNNLGVCYENGIGVPKDMSKAIELYQRSADLGNARAMVNLGYCYFYSKGVQQNMKKAAELYQRAADLDNLNAMYELARCYAKGHGVSEDMEKAFELFQKYFGTSETRNYNEKNLDHVIKLALASCYSDYYINNFEQWNNYTESIKQFLKKNNFSEFNIDYTLEFKKGGSDLGLTIIKKQNGKKYFLKIYPYSEKTYKEKLIEVEHFKLFGSENSMKVSDLYVDKANGCIIFCSEQALTGEIELFPKFDFETIKMELKRLTKTGEEEQKEKKEEDTETREIVKTEKGQPKTSSENNQEFKNLCQFFKIMIYSAMHNLGDIRDTNVLMALEEQDKNKVIRIKLIDFWLGRHGNEKSLPDEIKLIDRNDGKEKEIITKNPFLPENILSIDSPSQIFLKQCIYLFLLAQSRENFGTITTPTSQGVCSVTKKILEFIQQESQIAEILEEKVLKYIEEVFGKIEELSQETETKSKQLSSEQTTAVSSTTPPLPTQSSCDDTTKLSETPEQSKKDLRTLLEVRVEILKQFCERYQYIQEQLRKCSQSKTTNKPTEEVKPLPKAEQQLPEIPNASELEQEFTNASELEQQFTNPSSTEPTSIVAVAAAASATLATVVVGYANIIASLAARQVRLEKMRKRIATIQERIDGESQTSTSKNQKLII